MRGRTRHRTNVIFLCMSAFPKMESQHTRSVWQLARVRIHNFYVFYFCAISTAGFVIVHILLFPLIWIIYHFIRFIIGEFYFNGIVNLIRFLLHLIKVHPILILKRKFIVSIDWHRNQIKDQNPKSYTYNIYIQARIQKYFPGGSNKTHCTHTETPDY